MNTSEAINVLRIMFGTMFFVTALLFSLSSFFSFYFIYKAKWTVFSFVKAWIGVASLVSVVGATLFGIGVFSGQIVIERCLNIFLNCLSAFLLSGALAVSAIVRFQSLLHGGESWKMRN